MFAPPGMSCAETDCDRFMACKRIRHLETEVKRLEEDAVKLALHFNKKAIIEECAKVAENTKTTETHPLGHSANAGWNGACETAAKFIRKLKGD